MKRLKIVIISLALASCDHRSEENEIEQYSIPCTFDYINSNILTAKQTSTISTQHTWRNGQVIRIKFLDGDAMYHEKVKKYVGYWAEYANLTFKYVDINEFAEIRVGFNIGRYGAWSALGTNSSYFSNQNEPSMRLGPLNATDESSDRRTVLHEFGHALGLIHEQLNPVANINWNLPKVYKYYSDLMGWSKEEVDRQVINPPPYTDYSEYDPTSIMHYHIDPALVYNGVSVPQYRDLSPLDMISINRWYPFPIVSVLESGQSIHDLPWNKRIKSASGRYSLEFNDGRLQIIDSNDNKVIWEVGDYDYRRKPSCYFESTTGNIIIKGARLSTLPTIITWTSNTTGFPSAKLYLQDDGDLQLIHNNIVRWSSKTGKL